MADPTFPEAARAWLDRANSDLRSAHALLALDPPEAEATVFHAQQAAEKYLKGLLAYHGIDPPRTHDLNVLLDLTLRYDRTLEDLREEARFLVPFAVAARYPLTGYSVSANDASSLSERKSLWEDRFVSQPISGSRWDTVQFIHASSQPKWEENGPVSFSPTDC